MGGPGANKNCFQVFGLDILIDSKLQPWILEINSNPSLNVYSGTPENTVESNKNISEVDLYLKSLVLYDAIRLVTQ
jgi:D-alanine-D-alanine ligase-like ATP-grasp enzyme